MESVIRARGTISRDSHAQEKLFLKGHIEKGLNGFVCGEGDLKKADGSAFLTPWVLIKDLGEGGDNASITVNL